MDDDPVEVLRRWEDSGAYWRVATRWQDTVTIALLRCDGEEVDHFTSSDPRLLAFLGERGQ
ncbi:hypothetical protein [Mycolicibacterium brumae]|uniref:Uncharacterized protein n=1 Tax=Mycolicibacterium brumae TaxID=85968 RepID=A0A2G5P891_9MYCO|nr:hypothetical protein [Mycolicibacterium brumae]MCV7191303.1 hypothetical protein [Mycolicibacterium brumae]PIB74591.1 hypothetical protein CQY22_012850 [Mycolicibacterium brumae]UWW09598.1 hypothetical protein L2Z93_002706 [Mycolicibacterium brumae]